MRIFSRLRLIIEWSRGKIEWADGGWYFIHLCVQEVLLIPAVMEVKNTPDSFRSGRWGLGCTITIIRKANAESAKKAQRIREDREGRRADNLSQRECRARHSIA